jgi:hypothetical protein
MVPPLAKSAVDPRRYFEGVRTDSDQPAHDPVCLLSGNDQPLQSSVHHVPTHL